MKSRPQSPQHCNIVGYRETCEVYEHPSVAQVAIVMSSGAKSCRISLEAYGKINLHSAKHPTLVLGFLVGRQNGQSEVVISDVLPICHSNPVGPIFEVAGQMCESYFPEDEVIGVYYAPDQSYGNSNKDFPVVLDSVCEVIKKNNTQKAAIVVRLDTERINPGVDTEDVDSDDDPRAILTTEAFSYLSKNGTSSSSENRPRLNSDTFRNAKLEMTPTGSANTVSYNKALDKVLVNMRHMSLVDLQDHMGSTKADMADCRNTLVNIDLKS